MLELKLAEYDLKTGKFFRFLQAGNDFFFGGQFILLSPGEYNEFYEKDKKDPLNRFEGKFHNRSYGKGRFILMIGLGVEREGKKLFLSDDSFCCYKDRANLLEFEFFAHGDNLKIENLDYSQNIHENPELYEKTL